jgi:PhnB protein
MSLVQPYLSFEGRAEEAAEFYTQVLGAKVEMLMRFEESPDPVPEGMIPPGSGRKVMHMALRIGDSLIMGSDGGCTGKASYGGFSLAHTVATEVDAERVFKQLAEGGRVDMPLAKTFFSPKFGMLADKFGIGWMVLVDMPMPATA